MCCFNLLGNKKLFAHFSWGHLQKRGWYKYAYKNELKVLYVFENKHSLKGKQRKSIVYNDNSLIWHLTKSTEVQIEQSMDILSIVFRLWQCIQLTSFYRLQQKIYRSKWLYSYLLEWFNFCMVILMYCQMLMFVEWPVTPFKCTLKI